MPLWFQLFMREHMALASNFNGKIRQSSNVNQISNKDTHNRAEVKRKAEKRRKVTKPLIK